MRVYQLAKELNLSSKEVIDRLKMLGCSVGSHMALVEDDIVGKLRKSMQGSTGAEVNKKNLTEKISTTTNDKPKTAQRAKVTTNYIEEEVSAIEYQAEQLGDDLEQFFEHDLEELEEDLARHNRFSRTSGAGKTGITKVRRGSRFKRRRRTRQFSPMQEKAVISKVVVSADMPLNQVATLTGKSVSELVMAFLKKGKAYTVNYVIPKDEIIAFCAEIGIEVEQTVAGNATQNPQIRGKAQGKADLRMPIVVVMGHVDHGKTSLLDFIRKSSVAAGEAGGITQKISAYQVKTKHGEIIFIDTPGHEAFTLMRRSGAQITDIALIVIAADDGIMPQTQEAIELAKKTGAQIIVALNKIDKPGLEKQIENIKNQLANKHDLLIEEWGGDVILVPVSAKTGQGVDALLEMIALQSEIMGLQGYRDNPARAFVLESNFQKGLGPVSTVIVTEGELKRSDNFVAGKAFGKVRVMENSYGKQINIAGPSTLLKLVGFSALAEPGDVLTVVNAKDINKKTLSAESFGAVLPFKAETALGAKDNAQLRLVIKVGTSGSLDAVSKAFEKAMQKNTDLAKRLVIKKISVGDVSCSDVVFAEDLDASILVFATGIEHTAAEMAAEKKIKISSFSIIYRLIEAVEEIVKAMADQETVYKESGRAQVIKVFDIKGRGIIAGCRVTDGRFVRNGRVICMRNDKKIIETEISSLQHAKKSVSEVKKGFECGFMSDKFNDWREGDLVICLEPVRRGQLNA